MSGPSTFILSNAGHIQAQVNPPGNPKAHYFAGPVPDRGPRRLVGGCGPQSGNLVGPLGRLGPRPDARPTARLRRRWATRDYPVLAAAPGTYVHRRL